MDLQKSAPGRFSLRPVSGKNITLPVIEDVVDVIDAPGIHRVIAFDVWAAPAGQCGGLSDERGEAFCRGGVAAEIGVEDFEGSGVKIEFAPRHQLASLRLRLRLFAFVDAPNDEARDGQDDAAYHRRNERPPVASLALEPRFAKLRDEDHRFVVSVSRRNLA